MKLLFKDDKYVNGILTFKSGQVYEISDEHGSATRWIKRGAEIIDESPEVSIPVIEKKDETLVDEAEALASLGGDGEEEVVNKAPKKENKKEKKSSKQG